MTDIEKVLTEVRWILSEIVSGEPWSLKDAHDILTAFTADMPGAIGWFLVAGNRHLFGCNVEIADEEQSSEVPPCTCGLDTALANLEGK